MRLPSYIRPMSLTWWSGVFAFAVGVLVMVDAGSWAGDLGQLVAILSGGSDASPAALMALGLGLVGVRAKLERAYRGRPE
jgi:drug/metabolite transporter (DMT)-like permease